MKPRNRITIAQSQRLSLNLRLGTALALLRSDLAGVTAWIEEQAEANPALVLQPPPVLPRLWLPRWHDALARSSPAAGGVEASAAAAPGLIAHAMAEITRLRLSPPEARFALICLEALAPTGWLERPLALLAREAAISPAFARSVLERLQKIEPTGLFAENLADCLRLQAEAAGEYDLAMAGVLQRLQALAEGDIALVAREVGISNAAVLLCLARLRRYDPKPGARFEAGAAVVSEPDLILRESPDGPLLELNHSALPSLVLDPVAGAAVPGARARAQEAIRLVEGRNAMLLRIAAGIFRRQPGLLRQGLAGLQPLTLSALAAELGLHQTTVSRVVAGASVDTPRGTFWLRSLFSAPVGEGGPSAAALRDLLARLVAAEDPRHPLSDRKLAERLFASMAAAPGQSGGPAPGAPARRTIAKYREMLGIPPAFARKRRDPSLPGRARD